MDNKKDQAFDIIVDTREHRNVIQPILKDFEKHPFVKNVIHKKLDVGDYQTADNQFFIIDRKRSLFEMITNLGSDQGRFWREVRRAHLNKIKLTVLCENGDGIRDIHDVHDWYNAHLYAHPLAMTGVELAKRIQRLKYAYGVDFVFCERTETGNRIVELLQEMRCKHG